MIFVITCKTGFVCGVSYESFEQMFGPFVTSNEAERFLTNRCYKQNPIFGWSQGVYSDNIPSLPERTARIYVNLEPPMD